MTDSIFNSDFEDDLNPGNETFIDYTHLCLHECERTWDNGRKTCCEGSGDPNRGSKRWRRDGKIISFKLQDFCRNNRCDLRVPSEWGPLLHSIYPILECIIVCEADLYILMLDVSQFVYLV